MKILLIFCSSSTSCLTLNGHSYCDTAKVLKGCLKNNSKHFQFWDDEALPILKTIQFEKIVKKHDGTVIVKYEKVPSIQNWIHNINTFKELWRYLNTQFKMKNLI